MSLGLCLTGKQKQKQKWLELFLCVRYKLCLFCMLSMKDISECQLFIRAAIFIYLRIPEKVGVQVNLPNTSLHFRLYKGKKTPLLRKHSKCSAPQRCYFYLFLFIFVYLISTWYGILPGNKVSLRIFFPFSLVNCWYSLVLNLHMCL